jgi:Fic family protein
MGLRNEGGFVGDRDRDSGMPLPVHVSARHEDLPSLIDGLVAFDRNAAPHLDAVLAATVLAFGFVYIHPFADGNGRLHRFLIHHVLAERGFNPPGMVFPVSAAILDRIDDYRRTLESYSRRLLPLIKWESTDKGNVRVLNDTEDYYRFFDATQHAEFLYECVARTIDTDLPAEAKYLEAYDTFKRGVTEIVDMPNGTLDLLFRFLRQNKGALSKRGREKEFAKLTDDEVAKIEASYGEAFPSQ